MDGDRPAVGLGDLNRTADAHRPQALLQLPVIGAHGGPDVGVHHADERPLVFALLGPRLPRRADEELGPTLGDEFLGRLLMDRIDIGMQKADGHRRDARFEEFLDPLQDGIRIQRAQDAPVRADALPHLPDVGAADERHGSGRFKAGRIRKAGPAEFQNVAETLRRQKPGRLARALDDRVDRKRRACAEVDDVLRIEAFATERFAHAFQHAGNRFADRRRHFVDARPARGFFHQGHVRKGASDVHADPPAAQWRLLHFVSLFRILHACPPNPAE